MCCRNIEIHLIYSVGYFFRQPFRKTVTILYLNTVSKIHSNMFVVWLVVLVGTNLVKENEPEENPTGFSSTYRPSN